MRDRDELSSLIKKFVIDETQKRSTDEDDGSYDTSVHLIGGDLRDALANKANPIPGDNVVDPFRNPESGVEFLEAARTQDKLILEIGSARGHFCTALAQREPQNIVLACEVRSVLMKKTQKRRTRCKLDNLFLMLGDVRLHLLPLLEGGPLFDEIYILFPDPWWKPKHRKRRLFQPGFLPFLAKALKPKGVIILKTDVEAYRDVVEQLVRSNPLFVIDQTPSLAERARSAPPSRREAELANAELPVFTLNFRPS